ncbi:MAG: YpdA family putative bacillithiol disulfide reductase [Acidobacteria bacterium]|nr:YpdA family putative bacillithiol disulfide reductase [Acidobacteriota bacterium]
MKAAPEYDVVVVGAGPTGLACGIELQQRGLQTVLIEKGCVVNSIYHYPTHMTFFTTPELLEIGNIPMTSLNEKPNRTEALKYYRRVAEHFRLDIHQYETVNGINGEDNAFRVSTTDRLGCRHLYGTRKVVLATGFYDVPNPLGVPGEDLPKVSHYYKEPHPYYDSDVAVIGGSNSAAIAALELFWSGARVTLIHRDTELSRHVKYWIRPSLENRIKNEEIKAYFHSRVLEILPDFLLISTPEGSISLKNDFVLAMTGYRPDLTFLSCAGISLEPDTLRPRINPATLESERKGLYLAGVLVAGMHTNEIFIENGRFHGKLIANSITGKS